MNKISAHTKVYNDSSPHFADWRTETLKEWKKALYESIFRFECFGVRDMQNFTGICEEIKQREGGSHGS